MADPFDALRDGDVPVAPDPSFTADLRRRLAAALAPPPEPSRRGPMSDPGTSTAVATATPYLCVHDAAAAIDFYVRAFGAVETMRLAQPAPDTRLGHAEILVGGARIMLSDEFPELGVVSPRTLGGSPFQLHVTFDDVDVDALIAGAEAAGATVLRPPADQFYGERAGQVLDPFGHRWTLATSTEQVSDEEVVRRAASQPGAVEDQVVREVDLGTRSAPGGPDPREGDLGYATLDVRDLARAKAFFGVLLGWRFEGPPDGTSAHIGNVDPPMGLVGGAADPSSTLYFRVGDIRAATARTRELGGDAGEPTLSDSGWSAPCTDDQGTRFDLWQPAEGY